jgi:UDP-N-acetylglucosamine--dolichyl-phosphate N-acetylglucosaminephosphotransferase
MEWILFISIAISFIITIIFLPNWIKKCNKVGLLWEDMNKPEHPRNVASSGGIVVVMAFIIGVLSYIAIRRFFLNDMDGITISIFSLLTVITFLAIVGLVDDLLGWKHGGLSAGFRIFLALVASIPLIVINAGDHFIFIPFFGPINFGLLYTLILIPIGIAGATTTYNMLAGFNGLESGMGIIIIGFLSFIAYITGSPWLTLVGLSMVAALIGFHFYNKYPAKVFPGDILTYSVGALIAIMAILGNFEKIAIFIFIPYIVETVLKSRGKLKKQSFGIPQKDGSLKMPYNSIYGLTHLSIFILTKFKKKVYEKDVVYFIYSIEIILCLLSLLIFKKDLFIAKF